MSAPTQAASSSAGAGDDDDQWDDSFRVMDDVPFHPTSPSYAPTSPTSPGHWGRSTSPGASAPPSPHGQAATASAAATVVPSLFDYVRPPLGSLDPSDATDLLRVLCLLIDVFKQRGATHMDWNRIPRALVLKDDKELTVLSDVSSKIARGVAKDMTPYLKHGWSFYSHEVPSFSQSVTTLGKELVTKAMAQLGRAHGTTAALTNGTAFQEWWPAFDILNPSRTWSAAQMRHDVVLNPVSILMLPAAREIVATWAIAGPPGQTFAFGPPPTVRMEMWAVHKSRQKLALARGDLREYDEEIGRMETTGELVGGDNLAQRRLLRDKTHGQIAAIEAAIATAEAVRLRLATHLAALPGVVMDMAHDPMCPWKGMKFFHGTSNATLQEVAKAPPPISVLQALLDEARAAAARLTATNLRHPPVSYEFERHVATRLEENGTRITKLEEQIAAASNPPPAPSRYPCNLSFEGEYKNAEGEIRQGSAFLSPYYTKGFSYGGDTPHIYTYRLNVDGKALRFLDLRNDYVEASFHHATLDPFKPIWDLAGIPHAEDPTFIKVRDEKARNLYELFRGTPIDGAVMNSDVEFIFFDAPRRLDWVVPDDELTGTLLNRFETGPNFDLSGLAHELTRDVERWITPATVIAFLSSPLVHRRTIQLSELPVARWKLDTTAETYISQFAVNRPTASPLWNEFQHLPALGGEEEDEEVRVSIEVCECDYRALWRHFAPDGELDDIWMADAITEGEYSGISRKTPLAYHRLCAMLRQHHKNVHLLVHLPNGFVQIVPTLRAGAMESRMFMVENAWAEEDIEDLPRRDLWKPASAAALIGAFLAGSKRKKASPAAAGGMDDEGEEKDAHPGQKPRTGAKLCIV